MIRNTAPPSYDNLTVLLPTRNEEQSIKAVLQEVLSHLSGAKIVVADSSEDETPIIALNMGATVFATPPKGKAFAIRDAVAKITTPYVIMMNSDFTYPAYYGRALYALLEADIDVVVGCRVLVDKGSMTALHSIGNFGLSALVSVLYFRRVIDACSGMWGFKTDILQSFDLKSKGFQLEADLLAHTIKGEHKFAQVPIGYRARLEDSRAKLTAKDGLKIAAFMIKSRFSK
jgi:glycosyltransferase involved in cell wall biosynthesis